MTSSLIAFDRDPFRSTPSFASRIRLLRPCPRQLQAPIKIYGLTRHQFDLEVSRDGHERRLDSIVIYIVRVRGLLLAGYNLEARDQAN